MTDEELAAIKARRAAITDGPWRYDGCSLYSESRSPFDWEWIPNTSERRFEADGTFMAHAPTDIDTLLAEVERLRALDRLFGTVPAGEADVIE